MNAFFHISAGGKVLAWIHATITAGAVAGGAFWAAAVDEQAAPQKESPVTATRGMRPSPVKELAYRAPAPRETLFIVDSEERAALIRAGLAEAAAFRLFAGLPPLIDEVIVVGSRSEVARYFAALSRESAIHAATMGQELVVIAIE